MSCFVYKYYSTEEKVREIFKKRGYITETTLSFLKREFHYKSGKEVMDSLGVRNGFLTFTLVYKEEEKDKLYDMMSATILKFKESGDSIGWYYKGRGGLSMNLTDLSRNLCPIDSVSDKFGLHKRLTALIDEFLGIDRNEDSIVIY